MIGSGGGEAPPPPAPPKPLCKPLKVTDIDMEPSVQEVHVENWLDAIRSRKLPNADVEIGHRVATACHLAVISYKTRRRIRWNSAKEEIGGDPEAQQLLSKQCRAPWLLPKV
jgi:hypothetical protein